MDKDPETSQHTNLTFFQTKNSQITRNKKPQIILESGLHKIQKHKL